MSTINFLNYPNGSKMPLIGLGTWQLKDEGLEIALNAALEIGYRHIDTAYVYENEAAIGRVLKKWLDSGKLKREDLFITTKLPMVGIHPDRVEHYIKKSLANLQLAYVDLYLVHFAVGWKPDGDTDKPKILGDGKFDFEPSNHIGVWKKMEEQVDAGRAKSIGLSNFNISQIEKVLKIARIKPSNLQVELHVYLHQNNLINYCQANNISVTAFSPLASPGFNIFLKELNQPERNLPDVLNNLVIKKIAEKHQKSSAQIALKFLVQKNVAIIPRSAKISEIKQNFDLFNFQLDNEDIKNLNALDIGEAARVADFKIFPGVEEHAEYPFAK